MGIPTDFYYYIASYGGIILLLYMGFNWLTGGFLKVFLKIKMSRGKKLLVRVHTRLMVYNVVGWLEGGDLIFFDREAKANKQKTPKRLTISDNSAFYRFAGVWCVDIDETTNAVLRRNMEGATAFDPIRWNNLLTRALAKPSAEQDNKLIPIITMIAVIIILFICIYLAVQVGQLRGVISVLQARLTATTPTITGVSIP